jgi:hypothetical protein
VFSGRSRGEDDASGKKRQQGIGIELWPQAIGIGAGEEESRAGDEEVDTHDLDC